MKAVARRIRRLEERYRPPTPSAAGSDDLEMLKAKVGQISERMYPPGSPPPDPESEELAKRDLYRRLEFMRQLNQAN